MERTRSQRLAEFFRRLKKLGPAATLKAARKQIEQTLTAVEDELTSIPSDPKTGGSDGRMYPPQDDAARADTGRKDVVRFRSKGHNTFIRDNGAIEIQEAPGNRVVFEKAGVDGRKVWDP